MPARIHPGRPTLSMDHSVITVRDAAGTESGFLSLYDIHFSVLLGAGHVALLRVPAAAVDVVLTDRLELGRKMQARLRGMGSTMTMLEPEPVVLTDIRRDPWIDDWFGYRLRAPGLDVAARWEDLEEPFFAEGPAPAFAETEDIWSLFVGARRASITVNGVAAPGGPFDDDVWVPKLGRSVSSAHSALGETRITPHPERRPG
jgi:hypothetical protein